MKRPLFPAGGGKLVEGKLVEENWSKDYWRVGKLANREIGRRIIRQAENWSKGKLTKGQFAHFCFSS